MADNVTANACQLAVGILHRHAIFVQAFYDAVIDQPAQVILDSTRTARHLERLGKRYYPGVQGLPAELPRRRGLDPDLRLVMVNLSLDPGIKDLVPASLHNRQRSSSARTRVGPSV